MLTLSEVTAKPGVIQGAKRVFATPYHDFRGTFEVFWETADFLTSGLSFQPTNCAFSYNHKEGTLRGLHYQKAPHGQTKLVTCARGRIWDVIADLRPDSPTYMSWAGTELSEASGEAIYIPGGCAHGFVTLTDNAIVSYLIEGTYIPESAGIVRWNDPSLQITWPISDPILAQRDRIEPDFVA